MQAITEPTTERDHELILPDGRSCSYATLGAPEGPVVVVLDGPGSRGLARAMSGDAAGEGIRLIAPDRPGFFGSSPHPGATIADWPADLAALLDHLFLDRVGIAAQSGGTPFAFAAALALPERVGALSFVGPVAPFDVRGAMKDVKGPLRTGLPLARRTPWLLRPLLRAASRQTAKDPRKAATKALKDLAPADAAMMRDPALYAIHERATAEILSRPDALLAEMRLIGSPWKLDIAAVTTPISIWVGEGDTTHPPVMSQRLAALLPGDVPITVVAGAGTFGVAPHYPDALRFAAG